MKLTIVPSEAGGGEARGAHDDVDISRLNKLDLGIALDAIDDIYAERVVIVGDKLDIASRDYTDTLHRERTLGVGYASVTSCVGSETYESRKILVPTPESTTTHINATEHFDGLDLRYSQANTLLDFEHQGRRPSDIGAMYVVRRYSQTEELHEVLVGLRAQRESHGPGVPFYRKMELGLWRAMSRTDFTEEELFVGLGQTIFFPNGYPATEGIEPAPLWTHTARTVKKLDDGSFREVGIGRVMSHSRMELEIIGH